VNGREGEQWVTNFMNRNSSVISVRKPQAWLGLLLLIDPLLILFFLQNTARLYHMKPTKDLQVLLLLDSHESHITVPAVSKYRENGVIMLTFPPHTSHWIDVSLAHLRSFTM
jgi:hypothetical protein